MRDGPMISAIPLHLATSLAPDHGQADALKRCRECPGYGDPRETHATCTITGRRRPGYGAQCAPSERKALQVCPACGAPSRVTRRGNARYCVDCRGALDTTKHRQSRRKEGARS
jgi:hypothetical protein